MTSPRFVQLGAILGFLAVALGAFGAHSLRDRLDPAALEIWRTASLYHLVHAVALVAVALGSERIRGAAATCWCFVIGIAIFGGTLYLLALTGEKWLGAITPLGGASFLAGWLLLAIRARAR